MFFGESFGLSGEYSWITQKEKLVRFAIFIVDAINNGHGN
jgi:hypothetical protein